MNREGQLSSINETNWMMEKAGTYSLEGNNFLFINSVINLINQIVLSAAGKHSMKLGLVSVDGQPIKTRKKLPSACEETGTDVTIGV